MRTLIGWKSVLYQSTDAQSNPWRHSARAGKDENLSCARLQAMNKTCFLAH